MSGPIVRKYGFPNHEEIFGRRPPEHGVEGSKKEGEAKAEKAEPKEAEKKDAQRGA